jgi:hypothetical protein
MHGYNDLSRAKTLLSTRNDLRRFITNLLLSTYPWPQLRQLLCGVILYKLFGGQNFPSALEEVDIPSATFPTDIITISFIF